MIKKAAGDIPTVSDDPVLRVTLPLLVATFLAIRGITADPLSLSVLIKQRCNPAVSHYYLQRQIKETNAQQLLRRSNV